jgi:hypothetical protein
MIGLTATLEVWFFALQSSFPVDFYLKLIELDKVVTKISISSKSLVSVNTFFWPKSQTTAEKEKSASKPFRSIGMNTRLANLLSVKMP